MQLNVWISVEAKQYLDERFKQEGRHLNEQIEDYIRQDMAVHEGEIVEQQSLPVIREMVDTTLRKYTAQLRADLRGLRKQVTPSGNIRFEGEAEDSHCDRTWAKALRQYAARNLPEVGAMVG